MKSKNIICSVPDQRKAMAVKNSLEQLPDKLYPASILQEHPNCKYYFDKSSAAMLSKATVARNEVKEVSY
jgi:glucosamine-6-phosphate deaminase